MTVFRFGRSPSVKTEQSPSVKTEHSLFMIFVPVVYCSASVASNISEQQDETMQAQSDIGSVGFGGASVEDVLSIPQPGDWGEAVVRV